MTATLLDELKRRIANKFDADEIVEILELTSEQILDAFEDELLENLDLFEDEENRE